MSHDHDKEARMGANLRGEPDTRAAPPLTADDVRRIAREEVAKAMADRPEPNSPTMTLNSTQPNTWPAAVEPSAQPAAAKRVEAWMDPVTGCVTLIAPGTTSGWTYLAHFPGVTDAASAAAFERAIRRLFDAAGRQSYKAYPETHRAWTALAPFLPAGPR